MFRISINLSIYLLCIIVVLQSCHDQIELPEYPITSPVTFTPCDKNIFEALDQYLDTTWNAQRIHRFIQGTWRFYAIQGIQSDTVTLIGSAFETELRFSETTMEVYEPYNVLVGSGEYKIDTIQDSNNRFFRITITSNEEVVGGRVIGSVIPCNSDLIMHRSQLDIGDWYYQKVE